MDELRRRMESLRPSNWEAWPTLKGMWVWFAALAAVLLVAIPWGIRAEERSLEDASREALEQAGFEIEDVSFTGRRATVTANLSTNDQNAAVAVLARMGGVAQVTWEEGGGAVITPTTTTTTTTVAPTTTVVATPGARLTLSVRDDRMTLRGTVRGAQTIKDLTDAAAELWGDDVVNQLFVDSSLDTYAWLGTVDDAVGMLTMLIDPQLTLDAAGATITGGAIDETDAEAAIDRLQLMLGADVAVSNKIVVTPLTLPEFEIVAPGDGTVTLTGTVANASVRRSIVGIIAADETIEVTNEIRLSDTTADVYLLRRIPELITVLNTAEAWTLSFDGQTLGGSATGGKAFNGNRVKPTAQTIKLAKLLGRLLQADPRLNLEIEVHAEPREENVEATQLARRRADAIAARLVPLGIDPERVSATDTAGEGELLRFRLLPADQ